MRVTLDEVSVRFGERTVLNGLSGEMNGGVVALMGPSGCGKTTLLGVIAGHVKPHAGTATVNGGPPGTTDLEWIVQSSPLLTRRTAWDNVILGPLSAAMASEEAATRTREAVTALGIDHLAKQRVYRLSGGERQRVAVARAIATDTPLLLADEPTASLDPWARAAVCDALDAAATAGALVLVATHDPYVADRATRCLTLDRGRLADA